MLLMNDCRPMLFLQAEATGAEGAGGRRTIVKMIRNHWLNRAILTATVIMLALCILLVLVHKSRLFRLPI